MATIFRLLATLRVRASLLIPDFPRGEYQQLAVHAREALTAASRPSSAEPLTLT
jgi:hypothetical protein